MLFFIINLLIYISTTGVKGFAFIYIIANTYPRHPKGGEVISTCGFNWYYWCLVMISCSISCTCQPFVYLCLRLVFSGYWPILNFFLFVFLLSSEFFTCFKYELLSDVWFTIIFFLSIGCLFTLFFPFLYRSFLDGCSLTCLCLLLLSMFSVSYAKVIWQGQHAEAFPVVSSRSCTVSGPTLKPLIHYELMLAFF